LYSSQVSLGAVPAGTAGLDLSTQLLGNLHGLTALTIGSSSTIDFYGAVQLGTPSSSTSSLNSITLDASGLGGYGAGDKVLQAGSITLVNSGGGASTVAAPGQLTLGNGAKTVSGISGLDLQASGDIVGDGMGSLTVAAASAVPVNLTSVALVGTAGSDQSLATTGTVTITGSAPNSKVTLPAPGLGAELAIQGGAIAQNGTLDLPAGIVSLDASSGNVTLGKGSLTSAAGAVQGYTVTSAVAPGGQITLCRARLPRAPGQSPARRDR
jgi:hypothetical protein